MPAFVCAFALLLLTVQPALATDVAIDGTWEGTLVARGTPLRVVFHFAIDATGVLKATLDSPSQNVFGVSFDAVTRSGDAVRCELKSMDAQFVGKLDEAGRTLGGDWTQDGVATPLTLRLSSAVSAKRPQDPIAPYPYLEEEVSYENPSAGVRFAGTFTRPQGRGRFPAVLLITGSGLQNRNEEIAGHKSFLVLSDYLTRRGIATLRVDDRGVGGTSRGPASATTQDFVADALAGVAYLKRRSDVDSRHIGLIGHSEGGLIAPAAAVESADVAFIVLLAGTGVRGVDVVRAQSVAVQAAQGVPQKALEINTQIEERLLQIALKAADMAAAEAAFDAYWAKLTRDTLALNNEPGEKAALEGLGRQLKPQLLNLLSPWMHYFLRYDPAPVLRKVTCPVLALNGSLDTQVISAQNLSAIAEALRASGSKDFSVKELPGLNHLFQPARTGAPEEYASIEQTFDVQALTLIGDWVVGHSR